MGRFLLGFFWVVALFQADLALARIGVQYQMALGNPTEAKSDTLCKTNYLIKRAEYALSYNSVRQQPNWVSWSFTLHDRGSSGRSDNFSEDKTLPSGFARLDGSTFGGGLDRGHMCPSADRTLSPQHNEVTFIMSNIAPQAAGNNRGPWNDFEQYCRELASGGQEVLIICGPSEFKGRKTAAGVPVPENFWKIAVVRKEGGTITSSSRVIAVSMPNENDIQGTSWTDYITSVEQIEKDTGYKFFDTITASTASNLKVVVDKSATGKHKGIEKEQGTALASAETKEEPKPQTPTPVVAQAPPPPPVTLPESQSIVIFRKTADGPIESKVAKAKRDGDAVEIVGEDGKMLLLGSRLVLVIAPLPPAPEIQLTKEQVELALSRYEKAEKTDELKTLLADGRAKWTAIKATLEAPVVASTQPEAANELDVPTAAGVEEPEPVMVKVEAKPETGWRAWIKWTESFIQKIFGR
ncbi:MAG: DNA/RNA non-specific endonuclease [Bacteroidia bacterium]